MKAVDLQARKRDEIVRIGMSLVRRYTRIAARSLIDVMMTREDLEQANATLMGKPTGNHQPDAE